MHGPVQPDDASFFRSGHVKVFAACKTKKANEKQGNAVNYDWGEAIKKKRGDEWINGERNCLPLKGPGFSNGCMQESITQEYESGIRFVPISVR